MELKPGIRFQAVDVLRALTMFLMIFVNDVGSVKYLPHWVDHVEADVDGMGFADTIFPAFLFIVGLSLPFALQSRMNKGKSFLSISLYIVLRSVALIVMGFFHVNSGAYSEAALLPRPVWTILTTFSFFLIWMDYPKQWPLRKKNLLVALGIVLLVLLACLYKGGKPGNLHWMRPSWWGILGIIGWAYLVCAFVYLLSKGKAFWLGTALVLFFGINLLSHAGLMPFEIWIVGDASNEALIMFGVLASLLYVNWRNALSGRLLAVFSAAGVLLIILGLLVRPFTEGISKINATPAWVAICAGISLLAFALMIFVVELKGKKGWFSSIDAAGTSTLTCYLIPYFLYAFFELAGFWYPDLINTGIIGVLRSFIISFLIILLVRQMEKRGIRLKI
ncbi:putative acyltransferase [Pedobacter sp. AK017]|uniref:DUF5009 domain-containing protein n=1 Tax=Pedobacter sp. AK017 TaxID=2723073 RepID=UPI001611FE47|nr:DUF5009 domain-containing protein [Pedobacter sp. AK017]MBB5437885.1 putative acyltransferase [Pedobacter sp. AK017]